MLRIDLEYDGTDFLGWQRQAEGRTVQATLEAALEQILGEPHRVVGAGRTDAGVHARQMVVSCPTRTSMPPARLGRALDAVLPRDVGIRAVEEAGEAFHARRDAAWKWYRYAVLQAPGRRPLLRRQTWQVRGRLDASLLDSAAAEVRGRHDFASFGNAHSPRRSTERTLYGVVWTHEDECLHLDVVGDGFLYKMIRTLAGTMVQLARHGQTPTSVAEDMRAMIAARDRRAAGPAAPARGLCLMAVGLMGEDPTSRLPSFLARAVDLARGRSLGGRT